MADVFCHGISMFFHGQKADGDGLYDYMTNCIPIPMYEHANGGVLHQFSIFASARPREGRTASRDLIMFHVPSAKMDISRTRVSNDVMSSQPVKIHRMFGAKCIVQNSVMSRDATAQGLSNKCHI